MSCMAVLEFTSCHTVQRVTMDMNAWELEKSRGSRGPGRSRRLSRSGGSRCSESQDEPKRIFGQFYQLAKVKILVCLSHSVQCGMRYGVLLKLKEYVMYGLRCTNIEGWGGIRMGGRSLCYLFQPVCIQRSWVRPYNGIQHAFHRTNSLLQEQTPGASYTNLCLRPHPLPHHWHWCITELFS